MEKRIVLRIATTLHARLIDIGRGELSKRAPCKIAITLLLTGMLTLESAPLTASIQYSGDAHTFTDYVHNSIALETNNTLGDGAGCNLQRMGGKKGTNLDVGRNATIENMEINASSYGERTSELIIGLDTNASGYHEVKNFIAESGAKIINTVFIQKRLRAFVVEVPFSAQLVLDKEITQTRLVEYVELNTQFKVSLVPNDPGWFSKWGLRKIEADHAWNKTTGNRTVVIAIVDTGVNWNHPDLAANIWRNTDEIADNKEDDDGNGYIDDVIGWDFVDTTTPVYPSEDGTQRDNDPMDFCGHGTHCAGIAAAVGNNSIGVVGVTWNCKVMAVRAGYKGTDGDGYLEADDAAEAIIYAVDNGAKIISCSWGGNEINSLIRDAIRYAYENGVSVVAAAGNDMTSQKVYPAAHEEVIAVTATGQLDEPTFFTNYGDWVCLAAPGDAINSTYLNNDYTCMWGTSMSTPFVTGTAALIWSRFPYMTRDCVQAQLQHSADDLGDPGFDVYYGFGRINAKKAVEEVPPDDDVLVLHLNVPSLMNPGKTAIVEAAVLNRGMQGENNLGLQLLVNGSVFNSTTIDFLASGSSFFVSYSLNTTQLCEGIYNITSHVLPVPNENLTENNSLSRFMRIRAPKTVKVPEDCETIQAAVDVAIEGDTILVSSGMYYEYVHVEKNNLVVLGGGAGVTVIDGEGKGDVIFVNAKNVSVSGFTVRNSRRIFEQEPPFAGILVYHSNNCTFTNVTTVDNCAGIFIYCSTHITLRNNNMSGNIYNFGIDGLSLDEFTHNIDESNIVDGRPVCYRINQHNHMVPSNAGCAVMVNCTRVCVKGLNTANNYQSILFAYTSKSSVQNVQISNSYLAIYFFQSNNNTIYSNTLTENEFALLVIHSEFNNIRGNTIKGCLSGIETRNSNNNFINFNSLTDNSHGIFLRQSHNNTVYDNLLLQNFFGVWVYFSDTNYIILNRISSGTHGLFLTESSGNVIRENIVSNSTSVRPNQMGLGIGVEWSFNNTIYHNNFLQNSINVLSFESLNIWDYGYPSGGNYWSDYADVDVCSGPHQNETGSDGIWDHPHVIDDKNQDNYALVQPYHGPVRNLNTGQSCPAIEEAINDANEGDTIFVSLGIYFEHVIVNKTVELVGEDRGSTIIDGNGTLASILQVIADNVTVRGFTIQNDAAIYGFEGGGVCVTNSSGANIIDNIIKDTQYGVNLRNSKGNFIVGNTIMENDVGIQLHQYSSNNTVYHNNFFNNGLQVSSLDGASNFWDNGYPSGGNYYSDHNPLDEDQDGTGDVPYVIDENNTDRYPLIYPYGFVPKSDVNEDGTVNIMDIATVARAYSCKPGDSKWNPIVDMDINETININDIATVAKDYGKTT